MLYGLIGQKVNSVQGPSQNQATIHQQVGLDPYPPKFLG